MTTKNNHVMVDINEIITCYLPVSKKKARKFASLYLETKKIGNRLYVEREKLEELLYNSNRDNFPLDL